MADFRSSSALSEGRSRARCERSVLWLRAARMCQVQSIRPKLILPEHDCQLSPPWRTEHTDLEIVGFSALRESGPGHKLPFDGVLIIGEERQLNTRCSHCQERECRGRLPHRIRRDSAMKRRSPDSIDRQVYTHTRISLEQKNRCPAAALQHSVTGYDRPAHGDITN